MSVEDFWWDTHNELKELGLQKKFDKQVKKMKHQDKLLDIIKIKR